MVSARVPAAVEYADVVEIADGTVDSWLLSLASALGSQQDGEAATARQTVALANTWDARVQQIETLMADAQRNTA